MAADRASRRVCTASRVALASVFVSVVTTAVYAQQPIAGANVNIIRGTTLPDGDPSMQRQNEPSIAISTRNPCHLLAGANDYRIVKSPDPLAPPDPSPGMASDAWLSIMKSFDCGATWQSSLLSGYPDDPRPEAMFSPLRGYEAGADPTVRAGTNGLFYYSGMVFDRGSDGKSRLFVARFVDNNDRELGDTIQHLGTTIVEDGTKGQFVDKPWMAVDIPRAGYGPEAAYWSISDDLTQANPNANGAAKQGATMCSVNGQSFPAGHIYLAWTRFDGQSASNTNTKIMFARSTDCGVSWHARPISSNQKLSQGAMIAIAPDDGTVYIAWREFPGGGKPSAIHLMRSRDGGSSFDKPKAIIATFTAFDHPKTPFTFRSNALPTIAAAPDGLVYVAVAARGYGRNLNGTANDDSRIILTVSRDSGVTFGAPFAIDNNPREPNPPANPTSPPRGHQFMPALAYAAGKLQIAFYDARDDVAPQRGSLISDDPALAGNLFRHTVDVRGSWATVNKANPIPAFAVFTKTPQGVSENTTLKLSKYAQSATQGTVHFNYANLTMYQAGALPFIGDYMDTQGLTAVPIRGANDVQQWRPNIPVDFSGMSTLSSQDFPTLPIFHTAWGDNRDVKWLAKVPGPYFDIKNQFAIPAYCEAALDVVGIRNANIYTSRMTPGLFVGSTGNTKPLGFVRDPVTGAQVLIRRGFTAFVQNTTSTSARYRLQIVNQPPGGRVSFRQSDEDPKTKLDRGPLTVLDAEVPAGSSVARTVYAQAPDTFAQILINVFELVGVPGTDPDGKPITIYNPKPNGLKSSLLLNPDKTNPAIKNPEIILDPNDPQVIPQIAIAESHDPRISEAFAFDLQGLLTTRRAITVPTQPGDPNDPNAGIKTPDLESPDLESPDLESPDLESPDLESPDLESGALGEGESLARVRDIHWTAKNGGNTTTTFRFRPSVNGDTTGLKFQMVVTRRYLAPAMDPNTCKLVFKTVSQVVVNVPNFEPRSPDLESPDLESPDLESPDLESASINNVTFALAPGEEATMTLRVMKVTKETKADEAAVAEEASAAALSGDPGFDGTAVTSTSARRRSITTAFSAGAAAQSSSCTSILDVDASGKPCGTRTATTALIQSQAANCVAASCDAQAPTASAGPDLAVFAASLASNTAAPGGPLRVNATVTNVGNKETESAFVTRFFLSLDNLLTRDSEGGITDIELTPEFLFEGSVAAEGTLQIANHQVTIPRNTAPGSYFVIVYTDGREQVFEPDDFLPVNDSNNLFAVPVTIGFVVSFTVQPSQTTQDFSIASPVVVAATDGTGAPVPATEVPFVAMSSSGGGLGGTLVKPNLAGQFTFDDLNIHTPGNHNLIAAAAGTFGATSAPFNVKVDTAPIAVDDVYVVDEDHTLETASDNEGFPPGPLNNDIDEILAGPGRAPAGRRLTILLVTEPEHGTVALRPDGENFVYTPAPNYTGPDSFTYRLNDGVQDSVLAATVSITVQPVNDRPIADGQSLSTPEDTPLDITLTGSDEESEALTFAIASEPAHGTLTGSGASFTYNPSANFHGSDSFTFTVTDGGDFTSAAATIAITVTPVNDAPVGASQDVTTARDTAREITLSATDIDSESLTFAIVDPPAHGTLSGTPPDVTYRPEAGYAGPDSFTFTASDGLATSDAATVMIEVLDTDNAAPTAVDDSGMAFANGFTNVDVVANDFDPETPSVGRVVAFERFSPPTVPFGLGFVNEVAHVPSSGRLYASGTRGIVVLDAATNAVIGSIDLSTTQALGGATFHQVNNTTSIVYFRYSGNAITAIDARTESATANQLIGRLQLGGSVQSFALDEARGLLYVATTTGATQAAFQARLVIVDANPLSETFHTVIAELVIGTTNIFGVVVDSANDRVYLAANGGLVRVDTASLATRTVTQFSATGGLFDLVMFSGKVYGFGGGGRVAAYNPVDNAIQAFNVPGFNTGFAAGRRIVVHAVTGRVFVRSGGQTGSAGKVVVLDTDTATWPTNAVLAEIPVGRDGGNDLVVDQSRNLVVTSSAIDNRVDVIDASMMPPGLSGAQESLPLVGEMELDPTTGRLYFASQATVQRMSLNPRAVLPPLHLGGENGFGIALPGPAALPNTHPFYIGRTALGASVRRFTIDGTPSDVPFAHDVGRYVFAAANRLTNKMYVVNVDANGTGAARSPSSVVEIDGATGAAVAIEVRNFAFGIGVNESTNKIYVGGQTSGLLTGGLSVIDGATRVVTAVDDSAFPPNTTFNRSIAPLCVGTGCATVNKVYVQTTLPGQGLSTVAIVNGATNVAAAISPSVGANGVHLITTSRALNRVFIGNQTDSELPNTVLVVNGTSDTRVTTLMGVGSSSTVLATQTYVAIDEQRGRVYVADFDNDRLNVLDGLTETGCNASQPAPSPTCYPLIASIATGDGPTSIAIDEVENHIYVTNANARSLTFIDGATFRVFGTLSLPIQPTTMSRPLPSAGGAVLAISGSLAEPGVVIVSRDASPAEMTLAVVESSLTDPPHGTATLDPDGTVRYTPDEGYVGPDDFRYRVTDGSLISSNEATVTVEVKSQLAIVTTALADGTRGAPYNQLLLASGGTAPYLWNMVGALPGGLRFNHITGVLSGTPTQSGTFSLTAQVRDADTLQQFTQRSYTLVISPFEVATTGLPTATLNQSYSTTLQAGGSSATPFTWDLAPGSSPLPEWLTLQQDGRLTAASVQHPNCSSISFTVRATDQLERTATRTLTLFLAGTIRITTTSLNGVALENFGPTVSTTCGSGTRTWAIDGTLPRGVTFNTTTGQFSSALPTPNPLINLGPKETGVFPVDITVSDSSGSDTKTVTINVHAVDQQPGGLGEGGFTIDSVTRIAQTVTVGATGRLTAVRFLSMKCAATTRLAVRILGVNPANGEPDETREFATTTVTGAGGTQLVPIPGTPSFTVDERLAVVLSADASCPMANLSSVDNYVLGAAFVSTSGGPWTSPIASGGSTIADYQIQTLIQNPALTYLNGNRGQGRAVMLNDGRALMVGSNGVAELIDLQSGVIKPVAMTASRLDPTVTLLADGRVLVTGGSVSVGGVTTYHATAELFDPATDTFATTGSMSQTRRQHAAVLLKCPPENPCEFGNKVLVTGGHLQTGPNTFPPLSTTELYDPATGTFTAGAPMLHPRNGHQLTRLPDGRVLVSGGFGESDFGTAEIYDPAAGTFTATAAMLTRRASHSATLLPDGTVLIAGGQLRSGARAMATRGEIYRPAANPADATFEDAGAVVAPRARHAATLLTCPAATPDCSWNGHVLLTGGVRAWEFTSSYATSERYVPGSGFVGGPSMNVTRYDHGALPLSDGRVLITGGFSGQGGGRQNGQTVEFLAASAGVAGTPSISNPNLPDGFAATPYPATTLTAIGGTPPYSITVAGAALPPGLASDGPTISGTPTSPGTYPFQVEIRDSAEPPQVAVQTLRIRVNALDITTSVLPNAYIGKPYAATVEATGVGAKRWSMTGNVPPGNPPFAINASTGEITGTATATGVYDFLVRVTDAVGQIAARTLSIQVNNPLTITTTSLGDGILGNTYGGCINRNHGFGSVTWTLSGNVPKGLAFRNNGNNDSCFDTNFPAQQLLQTGDFTFTVTVTDSSVPPQIDSRELSIRVHAIDQQIGRFSPETVGLDSTRRFAQVVTSGTAFDLTGVQLWSIRSCLPDTTINVAIRPVTGSPARPDESGGPLATGTVTTSSFGFNSTVRLSPAVSMPAHSRFAVVLSFANGACEGIDWPTTDEEYSRGAGWAAAGESWEPLSAVNGRSDVALNTLVMPHDLPYLSSHRWDVTSVALQDGRVLLVGPDQTAEIYDPVTDTLSPTGNMNEARSEATATLLADGRVAVIGGQRFDQATQTTLTLTSVEVFDPRGNGGVGSFSNAQGQPNAGAGNLNVARTIHAATLLNDGSGRILVTGGWSPTTFQSIRTAELYDPATGSSSGQFDMLVGRHRHTASLLTCPADTPECSWGGKVLLAGGYLNGVGVLPKAEIYDPVVHRFDRTANDIDWRSEHVAVPLTAGAHAGKIMLIGGTGNYPDLAVATDLFDPSTSTFGPGPSLTTPRFRHTATRLADGRVVVAGGQERWITSGAISSVEIYSPVDNRFSPAIDLQVDRQDHAAFALTSGPRAGKVLVAGGGGFSGLAARSAELVDADATAGVLQITTASLPDGSVGTTYQTTLLAASGGSGGGYVFEHVWGQLPDGLSFNAGTIAGSPQVGGVFAVAFRVTDSADNTAVKSFTIAINRLTFTSPQQLPDGVINVPYGPYQIAATGVGALTWTLENPLPADLTFTNGLISGTPRTSGFFGFNVRVRDAVGQVVVKHFNLRIDQPLSITTASLSDGILGNTYGGCVNRNNGIGPYTWTLSGNYPKGLAFRNNGVNDSCFDTAFPARQLLQTGAFTFTVTVTDSSLPPQTDSKAFTIQVHANDQQLGGPPAVSVPVTSGPRYAQVVTAGTAFDLTAIHSWSIQSCSGNTTINLEIRPVVGAPARPDDSVAPLATASVVTSSTGGFNQLLRLSAPVAIPQHGRFAVLVSLQNGSCQGINWPSTDNYARGDGWVDDGSGWRLLSEAIGRFEMGIHTLVMPHDMSYLSSQRWRVTSVMLQDGRILLIGPDNTAEIYDPGTHTVLRTGNMSEPRVDATATLLADGRVAVIGGERFDQSTNTVIALTSVEIFDPEADDGLGAFSPAGNLNIARRQHAAALLGDGSGRILVTGGWSHTTFQAIRSAELYDPATSSSTPPFDMLAGRNRHTATRLTCPAEQPGCAWNGKVLLAGGYISGPGPVPNAEIYDPATQSFTATANAMLFRAEHLAVPLTAGPHAGQIMLIGGTGFYPELATGNDLFDPATSMFSAGPSLNTRRFRHTATPLPDGRIVVAGGQENWIIGGAISSVEVYSPADDRFTPVIGLQVDRQDHAAYALMSGPRAGKVLVAGGGAFSALAGRSAELIDVNAAVTALQITTASLPDGSVGASYPPTTLTASGGSGGGYVFEHLWGQLPEGLSFNAGTIEGSPLVGGIFVVAFRVTDSANSTAVKSFTIAINRLTFTSPQQLPDGVINVPYGPYQIMATGVGPLTWTLENPLPADLTFTNGLISGTARTSGFFGFNVRVRDGVGQVAVKHFNLRIDQPLAISTTSLGDGILGNTYGGCLNRNSGFGNVTWTLSGDYPQGLAFRNNGVNDSCFDGTFPTRQLRETGEFTFTVAVTDSSDPPQTDSKQFTIQVHAHEQAFGGPLGGTVQLTSGNRYAQVFTAGTAFDLTAVELWTIQSCSANTAINVEIRNVVGAPARPDDSGGPIATASTVASAQGFIWHVLRLSAPAAIPQHGQFAVIVTLQNGSCQAMHWPTTDNYLQGDGWLNDGTGWTLLAGALGTPDMRINTLVIPNGLVYPSSRRDPGHRSVMLNDGRILLLGPDATADIYDPVTHTIAPTGSMSTARAFATATVLADGRVVVIGGHKFEPATNTTTALASIEVFDPAANGGVGAFSPAGTLRAARAHHTATLLNGNVILVAGGYDWPGNVLDHLRSAELFDVTTQGSLLPPFDMLMSRAQHTATPLPNNKVLLAGGYTDGPFTGVNAEIYDADAHTFAPTANAMATARAEHTATVLVSGGDAGKVMLIGGTGNHPDLAGNEYFDPETRMFSAAPPLLRPRTQHATTTLFFGQLMVLGGYDRFGPDGRSLADVEVFDPVLGQFRPAPDLRVTRSRPSAYMLTTGPRAGAVFTDGGASSSALAARSGEIVNDSPAALVISTTSLPDGSVGVAYPTTTLSVSSGFEPYTFTHIWGELPPGMTFVDGVFGGTPQVPGSYPIVVQVTDVIGSTARKSFTIVINRLTITTPRELPNASVGVEYSHQLTADGTGELHWTFTGGNLLPPGFILDTNGRIHGTAGTAGFFGFDVRVRDASGQSAVKHFNLRVN